MPAVFAQLAQCIGVVIGERGALNVFSDCSASRIPSGHATSFSSRHLQEEQVGELLDVVAVVDAVVAEGVAEAPKLFDNVGHDDGIFEYISEVRSPRTRP